nr:hypothetical protein [Tanacetum cinerariifolium]
VEITAAVEVLVLLLKKSSEKVHIDATGFAHLKKLRILKIYQSHKYLQEFELNYNVKFSGKNIVAIDLSYSNIKQLWTTPKSFRRLKVMKLRYCCNLTITPVFSKITNLEELNLEGCLIVNQLPEALVQVPESIGGLSCLEELDLEGNNFTSLPGSLSQLSHLRTLVLVGCKKLEVLPELPPSLWNIYASHCASLREVSGSSKDPFRSRVNYLWNCPNLGKVI